MGPREETRQNYERQRRLLNARLGLMVSRPSIASDLNCRWTFSAEDAAGSCVLGRQYRDSVSVVVEDAHNPLRASVGERRTRRIAWICRPNGFLCGLAAMLSWSVGTQAAKWVALAFAAAAFLLLWFSHFSDRKAEQELRSVRPTIRVHEGLNE